MTLASELTRIPNWDPDSDPEKARLARKLPMVMLAEDTGHICGSKDIFLLNIPSQVHVAGANTIHWDLFNASESTLVRVLSIRQIPNITTAVVGVVFDWKLARTTDVGVAGSALTGLKADLSQTALESTITARSKPTSGATEGDILFNYSLSSEETNAATIQVASQGGLELVPPPLIDVGMVKARGILLRKNQGIRVVQITNSAAGNTGWLISFSVEK